MTDKKVEIKLKRFWFQFEKSDSVYSILGYGVTAHNYDDAINLLKEHVFPAQKFPKIKKCIEDIDISELDQNHVVPNMGVMIVRGIWFPRLT